MEYQVLARKWRPQSFADVVGQTHITQTLQSELIQDKTAHAYLFVGPRGIGKTTIARIFAKAMNCKNAPIKEPCCQCESCISIAEGNSLDLIEIDGASNNSVEDIRQLREEVLYSPTSSRFKIYIIDEVHMLSTSAWNALLKTIEEPPPHAKFLFATTEAHKVLPTVVSRCQRFDLQRITFKLITEQMKKIATAENVQISESAIEVIARAADGGMRDAQSLLDQMIAFSSSDQGEISEEQALAIFGLTGVAEMERLILAILKNDRASLIASIHQLASHGKNLEKLFEDILAFLRGIQICMIMQEPEKILETGDDLIALYRKAAAESNPVMVQKLLENLSPVGRMLHDALNKQVFLETILLKAMRISHAVEIETLIDRLNQIRKGGELGELEKMPSVAPQQSASVPPVELPPPATPAPVIPPPPPVPAAPKPVEAPTPAPAPAPASNIGAVPEQNNSTPNPVTPPSLPIQETEKKTELAPVNPKPPVSTPDPIEPVAPAQPKQPLPPTSGQAPSVPPVENNLFGAQESQSSVSDMPPSFPAPPKEVIPPPEPKPAPTVDSAPPSESPMGAFESQALHVLEHPKETGPVKIDNGTGSSSNQKPQTPDAIWHAAIEDMEHCKQPLLKAYMQEGRPDSFIGGELTVIYDEESEGMHISELRKDKALVETCIRRVSGNNQATFNIAEKKGVLSPHDMTHENTKDLEEVKRRAEKNPFVKDVIDLFDAEIIDVRG